MEKISPARAITRATAIETKRRIRAAVGAAAFELKILRGNFSAEGFEIATARLKQSFLLPAETPVLAFAN